MADLVLQIDRRKRRIVGGIDDVYDLRNILRNACREQTEEELTRNVRQIIDIACKYTTDSHAFLANLNSGDQIVFVATVPPGYRWQDVGKSVLKQHGVKNT